MASEVSQGNEPFKMLPDKGLRIEEVKRRLQKKVRDHSTAGRFPASACLSRSI